jgi:signal transduction histidine kinase
MTGYTALLLSDPELGPLSRERVVEVDRAATRGASLTRQLLAFSRRQMHQPQVVDLNALLAEVDKLMRSLTGEGIQITLNLAPELRPVWVDPSHMEQVILNLVVNARDAMPHGGRLTLETADVDFDEESAAHHAGMAPGSYVMLAVSDTGCGMDAETQSRLFEPFFSTKRTTRSAGMGLATVYGTVKQTGGEISAKRIGRGRGDPKPERAEHCEETQQKEHPQEPPLFPDRAEDEIRRGHGKVVELELALAEADAHQLARRESDGGLLRLPLRRRLAVRRQTKKALQSLISIRLRHDGCDPAKQGDHAEQQELTDLGAGREQHDAA